MRSTGSQLPRLFVDGTGGVAAGTIVPYGYPLLLIRPNPLVVPSRPVEPAIVGVTNVAMLPGTFTCGTKKLELVIKPSPLATTVGAGTSTGAGIPAGCTKVAIEPGMLTWGTQKLLLVMMPSPLLLMPRLHGSLRSEINCAIPTSAYHDKPATNRRVHRIPADPGARTPAGGKPQNVKHSACCAEYA